jgi:hypothetical protein
MFLASHNIIKADQRREKQWMMEEESWRLGLQKKRQLLRQWSISHDDDILFPRGDRRSVDTMHNTLDTFL